MTEEEFNRLEETVYQYQRLQHDLETAKDLKKDLETIKEKCAPDQYTVEIKVESTVSRKKVNLYAKNESFVDLMIQWLDEKAETIQEEMRRI